MATRLRQGQGLGGDGPRLGIAAGRGQLRLCQTSFVVGKGSAHRKRPGDMGLGALKVASRNKDRGKAGRRPGFEVGQMSLRASPETRSRATTSTSISSAS